MITQLTISVDPHRPRKRKVDVEGQLAEQVERLRDGNKGHPHTGPEGPSIIRRHSITAMLAGGCKKRPREVEDSESLDERRYKAPRLGASASSQLGVQANGSLLTPESPASRPLEPQSRPVDPLVPSAFQTLGGKCGRSSVPKVLS
jgi:hypothetical protein